jgi:hypothetical protein
MSYAQIDEKTDDLAIPSGRDEYPGHDEGAERRTQSRVKVLKAAKISGEEGRTAYDCLVLDESPGGVLVETGVMIPLPSEITIQFSSGAKFRAEPKWTAGTRFGLQFVGPQIISHEIAKRLLIIADILKFQGIPAVMETLRLMRYFDNQELRRIAEDAEATHMRLDSVLKGKASL